MARIDRVAAAVASLTLVVVLGQVLPASAAEVACKGETATIVGTHGKDRIFGTSGPDVIAALSGRDIIRSRGGDDLICAGDGWDQIFGGAGDDVIYLQRNARGFEYVHEGQGDDVMDGGPGGLTNYLDFTDAGSGISADLVAGTVTGAHSGNDTVTRFHSIYGSSFDDVMIGGGSDNRFIGGPGNDEMIGGADDDYLDGGSGTDTGDGREGYDTCFNIETEVSCEVAPIGPGE